MRETHNHYSKLCMGKLHIVILTDKRLQGGKLAWVLPTQIKKTYKLLLQEVELKTLSINDPLKLRRPILMMFLLFRFPIWSYAKLGAICWLVLPHFNGAAYVYENFIRPFYRNPQVKIWYVPRKKDVFSKPDDVLTAAEKYIEQNGPEAFERLIAKADRESRTRRSNYMIFDDDYRYWWSLI